MKLVNKFIYLGRSVSLTEKDINKWLAKAWTAIHRQSVIWRSNLTYKKKRIFFQTAVVPMLLYGYIAWTLTKSLTAITQGCCELYWTSSWSNTPQNTYHPSGKLSKLDEQDMQDTVGAVKTNSWAMYSCGPLHIVEQRQDDQLEPIYNGSVPIQYIALKTSRKWWTIETGGERWPGKSVLAARHDDDNISNFLLKDKGFHS